MSFGFRDTVVPQGNRLKSAREALELSQEAFAFGSQGAFSVKTVRRAEAGKKVSREKLASICTSLSLEIDDVIHTQTELRLEKNPEALFIYHFEDDWEQFRTIPNNLFDTVYMGLTPESRAKCDFQELERGDLQMRPNYCWRTFIEGVTNFEYKFFDDPQNLILDYKFDEAQNSVIVLDLMAEDVSGVPVGFGAEAIQRLKSAGANPDIIIFSAYPDLTKFGFMRDQDEILVLNKSALNTLLSVLTSKIPGSTKAVVDSCNVDR